VANVEAAQVRFTTIASGDQSGIEDARDVVARTSAEWTQVWKEHAPEREMPAVDFTQSMVVGVFLGSRPTAGYAVEIISIERDGSDLVVLYRERAPGPGMITAQVITMPHHLVKLDRVAGAVRFRRTP
jgi:hypothetical protein